MWNERSYYIDKSPNQREFDDIKLLILSSPSWIRGGWGASIPLKADTIKISSTPLPFGHPL